MHRSWIDLAGMLGGRLAPVDDDAPRDRDGGVLDRLDAVSRAAVEAEISRRVAEATAAAAAIAIRNLELAQEGGRIGVYDIDMATGDATGSPMWAELLGQDRSVRAMTRRRWIGLLHPDDRDRVLAATARMAASGDDTLIEYRIVLPDGGVRWILSRNLVETGAADGTRVAYGTIQDTTERKAFEAQLHEAATHDDLTGLPNRRLFMEQLATACRAPGGAGVGVILYDLDHLKPANDAHGHDAGDHLLQVTGARLRAVSGPALVARLGGDEFATIVQPCDPRALRSLADASLNALRQDVPFGASRLQASASAGLACTPGGSLAADALLRRADLALLEAKRAYRGGWRERAG